jgi:hypothetical protein
MRILETVKNYFSGSHRLRLLLCTLFVLVVSDGIVSRFLITQRFGIEANPLLRGWVGDEKFLMIKVVGALIAAFILWDINKQNHKLAFISTVCFVTAYALIVSWNIVVFFIGSG